MSKTTITKINKDGLLEERILAATHLNFFIDKNIREQANKIWYLCMTMLKDDFIENEDFRQGMFAGIYCYMHLMASGDLDHTTATGIKDK